MRWTSGPRQTGAISQRAADEKSREAINLLFCTPAENPTL